MPARPTAEDVSIRYGLEIGAMAVLAAIVETVAVEAAAKDALFARARAMVGNALQAFPDMRERIGIEEMAEYFLENVRGSVRDGA